MNLPMAHATLENCRYCLMCRHVDPLSHVTFDETLTPHGIALTIASQRRGLIDWTDETVRVVFSELDNDNARAHCVTDQPFSDAVAAVKEELASTGRAPAEAYALADRLAERGTAYDNTPFESGGETGGTALLVSDEAHALRPAAVEAAKRLLRVLGHDVVVVGGGRNTGLVASSLGLVDAGRGCAERVVREVAGSGAGRVVVLGPGDLFALRTAYPERLGVELPDGVVVVELTSMLAQATASGALELAPASAPGRYAYIDPTYAVRVPERHDAPRRLLADAWGPASAELFWRRGRAHPVGSGGIRFVRPDVADALTHARLEDASDQGAEIVVSDDPATLWQLECHAQDHGLRVQGLFELLADALR